MTATMPRNAPYADVTVGEEVEIRVFKDADEMLVAECDFRGDTFGGKTLLPEVRLEEALVVDELVQGLALLVWNELLGTPVFREEDEQWVGRVEARAAWAQTERHPTNGWIAGSDRSAEPERREDPVAATIGDANVSDLRLTQEEMTSLTHGEVPPSLIERLLHARSTENLLDSISIALDTLPPQGTLDRAKQELAEVRRRFSRE